MTDEIGAAVRSYRTTTTASVVSELAGEHPKHG
jgi:hypothetical protein